MCFTGKNRTQTEAHEVKDSVEKLRFDSRRKLEPPEPDQGL